MASIAQLNVRLGLLYEGFDRSLQQVESKLRRSGQRMSQLGNDLTIAVSAPLLALGSAAIKQAANLESLENALASQMGSAEAARKELELLRQEALKPGLGFEQAVKGSVQLQAVGFSAEMARKTLSAFGNALAVAGKGKAELDGVALALTQISAKGKVSAEEINQIAERLPQIRMAMKAAFGTADTEALQKMGINSKQFIEGIVKQLEKIPPASNSLKNNLENAGDAINQFLASIGKEINKAFNLSEKSQQLSAFLQGAAQSFAALDDSTKRTIINFGLFALAAGPVVKVFGVMKSTGAAVISTVRDMGGVLKSIGGAVLNAAAAFQKLNLAMKLTVIGAAIAAVTALYFAYDQLANSMTNAEKAQAAVNDVSKTAANAIVDEKTKAELLVGVLKDQNATRADQQKALKELQAMSPQYFGNLDLEKMKVGEVDKALGLYVESLLRAAKAQAAFEQIKEINKQLNDLKESAEPSIWQTVGNAISNIGSVSGFAAKQAQTYSENITEQKAALNGQIEALKKVISENANYVDVVGKSAAGSSTFTGAAKDEKTAIDKLAESYRALDKTGRVMTRKEQTADLKNFKSSVSPGIDAGGGLPQTLSSIENPFAGIAESVTIATSAMQQNLTVMGQAALMYQMVREGTDGLTQSMTAMASEYVKQGQVLQAGALEIGAAIADAAANGASSLGDYAKAALGAGAKVIRVWIQMAVTRAALSALDKLPFPINIAAAAAAGGIAAGLFNALIKKVGIPALAEGGVASRPTLAMVGEYAGARHNPEIIAPENKIRNLFRQEMAGMGAGGGSLSVRVTGDDLLFILEKAERRQGRKR